MTTPNSAAEQTAAAFVEQQLATAERSLKITRLATLIVGLLVAGYAIGITTWMHFNVLEPTAAADIATARAVTLVQESGTALSDQIVHEVPALVAQAPDFVLEQMPSYRIQLEDQFEHTLADYGRELQPEMEAFLDQFITEHRDHIEAILGATSDPKLTEHFGDQLEQELLTYLKTPNEQGESVLDMLDQGRVTLEDVQLRLDRLAHAKDLSAEELKLRRIIAATMKATDVNL
jgi:hypothetical protein